MAKPLDDTAFLNFADGAVCKHGKYILVSLQSVSSNMVWITDDETNYY